MFIYGPGVVIASLAGGTPVNIGLVQEASYEEKASNKELVGQNRRAIAVGGGTIKATVKCKMARISGLAIAQLWLGIQPTVGGTFMQFAESHTLQSTSPGFTVAPPNSGTFYTDQGVNYTSSGLPLTNTTGAPSTGTYSVNTSTGVYAFAAGDELAGVQANYLYKTGGLGQSFQSGNPLLGNTVSVGLNILYTDPATNLQGLLQVFNVVFDSWSLATKLEDFVYPELSGMAYVNAAGEAWQWNSPDKF